MGWASFGPDEKPVGTSSPMQNLFWCKGLDAELANPRFLAAWDFRSVASWEVVCCFEFCKASHALEMSGMLCLIPWQADALRSERCMAQELLEKRPYRTPDPQPDLFEEVLSRWLQSPVEFCYWLPSQHLESWHILLLTYGKMAEAKICWKQLLHWI